MLPVTRWDHASHCVIRQSPRLLGCLVGVGSGPTAAAPVLARGSEPLAAPGVANLLLGWNVNPTIALPLLVTAVAWWRLLATGDLLWFIGDMTFLIAMLAVMAG